ncbi:MAG: HDIG domain-containing protein [Actinobacteria bacterium]|nr:HDIG domain-containing protein [Actinomycetota bacterium]
MIARSKTLKSKTKEIIKSGEQKNLKSPKGFFSKYLSLKSMIGQRIYIFIFTVFAVAAILSYSYTPDMGIEIGRPSPRTIKANKNIQFEDVAKTEEDRDKNEAQVPEVYVYDPEVLNGGEGALFKIKYFYLLSKIVQQKQERSFEEKVSYLTNLFGGIYPESVIKSALSLGTASNMQLMEKTLNLSKEIMGESIKPTEVDFIKNMVSEIVQSDDDIEVTNKSLVTAVLQNNIEPTAVFDPEATEKAKAGARLNTPPHMITIIEGQRIISEGEVVDNEDIMILRKLGLLEVEINWVRYLYIFLIALVMTFLVGFYLQRFAASAYNNIRKVLIVSVFLIIFTAIIKGLTTLSTIHLNLWNYLFPIIAASMLTTIIFDTKFGIVITICLSIFAGIVTNMDFSITLAYLVSGIFSTYLVSNVSQRSGIMRSGFISALILAFLFFVISLFRGQPTTIALYTILGVLNGLICAVLTIGLLPFIESVFKIVTAMGLLELSHTDQPKLKEMLIKAPGTYNHSLLVAHLGENAAKAIGADFMLVKVAALYHDLGKLRRPEYFYENQVNMENIHDRLNPSMSKNIIANHIRDGIEDAIKNRIPRRVIQIISQHHGTSLMTYFYEKHKDRELIRTSNGTSGLVESHFRYQTRKPQSKEAAVLMLSDSVEAAVRSIEEITPKKIEQMVNYIVDSKIKDGQLNEADITLREINIIRQSLIDGLISIYHSRIVYPGSDLIAVGSSQRGLI